MQKSIRWEIEPNCNLKCKHCFLGKTKFDRSLSIEDNKKIVNKLNEVGINEISFTSKEPFLYNGIIDLIDYCKKKDISVSFVTNGTLIDRKILEKLIKCRIKFISLSLEGISEVTNDYIRGNGVFDKVTRTIKTINNINTKNKKIIPIVIQISLTDKNYNEADRFIDFFEQLGVLTVNIGDIAIMGNAEDNLDIKLDMNKYVQAAESILSNYALKKNKKIMLSFKSKTSYETVYYNTIYDLDLDIRMPDCPINRGFFTLLPDGTMTGCVSLISNMQELNTMYGNILEMDLKEYVPRVNTKLAELQKKFQSDGICVECIYRSSCNLCAIVCNDVALIDAMKEKCTLYANKLKDIMYGILHNQVMFRLKSNVYIINRLNIFTINKIYWGSKQTRILIENEYDKDLIIKMCAMDEYCYIDELKPKADYDYKLLIENIVMNDMISIKK
ncbi:radical SAM protein [Proteiniborus sp.]|uniref:radical SAM protein n=1 Tax=Proteiniborus sp. TaxID=2079015 RepID=UPI00331948DD